MTKLIRADLARLWRTVSFWICGGLMTALLFLNFLFEYKMTPPGSLNAVFGRFIVGSGTWIISFAGIFVSLFIGTDYANGTIRNKLSVGHSRIAVYFSNFAASVVGALVYCVVCWGMLFAVGFGIGWGIGIETGKLIQSLLICVLAIISACSLFVLVGMLITTKSSSAVITIVGLVGLFLSMAFLVDLLSRPEKDSMYVESPLRDILTVVCDVLPLGQSVQLEFVLLHDPAVLPLYSVGFTLVISLIGAVAFRVKNIK